MRHDDRVQSRGQGRSSSPRSTKTTGLMPSSAGAQPIFVPLLPPAFALTRSAGSGVPAGPQGHHRLQPLQPLRQGVHREELLYIGSLAEKYDAFVITDEVYEHIVFAPAVHTRLASLPGMRGPRLTCSSLSKTYSITGWRLGYLIGPAEVDRRRAQGARLPDRRAPRRPCRRRLCPGCTSAADTIRPCRRFIRRNAIFSCKGLDDIGLCPQRPPGYLFCAGGHSAVPGTAALQRLFRPGVLRVDDLKYRRRVPCPDPVSSREGASNYPPALRARKDARCKKRWSGWAGWAPCEQGRRDRSSYPPAALYRGSGCLTPALRRRCVLGGQGPAHRRAEGAGRGAAAAAGGGR